MEDSYVINSPMSTMSNVLKQDTWHTFGMSFDGSRMPIKNKTNMRNKFSRIVLIIIINKTRHYLARTSNEH